jgi:hypothetical protein
LRGVWGAQVGAEELPIEWVMEGEILELTWTGKSEKGNIKT